MSRLVNLAETLSRYAHEGQRYGKYDYFERHIEDVVALVVAFTTDRSDEFVEKCVIVAYLHDVLEDTDILLSTLYDLFGKDVDESLALISKSYCWCNNEGEISRTHPKTYSQYIEDIKWDEVAYIVKLADTTSNLQASVNDNSRKRIEKYTKQRQMLLSKE